MMSRALLVGCLSLFALGTSGAFGEESKPLAACRAAAQGTDAIADAAGAGPIEVPISVENGIALAEVAVEGAGPLPMMIDTGAVNAITPEAAALLGLRIERSGARARGYAGHDVTVDTTHATELRLGAAALRDPSFLIVKLPRYLVDRGSRPPIAGILGQEFFTGFVVRLDYQRRVLTLSAPNRFRYAGSGVCMPFVLDDRTPVVAARADGIAGLFAIDTGSNAGLVLAPDLVKRSGLDRNPAGLRINSAATDGLVENIVLRLDRFDLADATIFRPIALLRMRQNEISRGGTVSGTIGAKLLQQFVITFDYARQQLWFERSSAFGAKTSGGTTGFQAAKIDSPDFRVVNVIPSAPAAAAGLRAGDVITEIDGVPSATVGLADLAELTRRPDGTVIHLRVQRDGAERVVALTLRELVP
jgi:hypothetical protein